MMTAIKNIEDLYKSAKKHYQMHENDESLEELNKILEMTKDSDKEIKRKTYKLLAKVSVNKSESQSAIKFYLKELDYIGKSNYIKRASTLNNLGLLYNSIKDLSSALKYQESCMEAAEQSKDKNVLSIALRNLGRFYTLDNKHVLALRTHQRSLKLQKEIGDKKEIAATYETLAEDMEFNEDFDAAHENYVNARALYEELGLNLETTRMDRAIKKVEDWKADLEQYDEFYMYDLDDRDTL